MTTSEIILNIIVPIFAAALSGVIGGLFTYLGVKRTIDYNNKIYSEEKCEKVRNRNKIIISKAPNLEICETIVKPKFILEIYLMPYIKPKIISFEELYFDYDKINLLDENTWSYYDINLQNNGKANIIDLMVNLDYKSYANIYSRQDFNIWKVYPAKNYYSDSQSINCDIKVKESISVRVYYLKNYPDLKEVPLNFYTEDENNNCWFQYHLNTGNIKPSVISPEAYIEYSHIDNIYKWYTYDHLYYNTEKKKPLNKQIPINEIKLEKRKRECWEKDDTFKDFIRNVNIGKKELNS